MICIVRSNPASRLRQLSSVFTVEGNSLRTHRQPLIGKQIVDNIVEIQVSRIIENPIVAYTVQYTYTVLL